MNKQVLTVEILAGIAFTIGIISAIGSTCPTLDPSTMSRTPIMKDLQLIFIITTSITYIVSFVWAILIWVLRNRKSFFYNPAIINSVAGFLSGLIPSVLVMSDGLSFSPSLFRTFVNLIILIVLLIPRIEDGIQHHITGENAPLSETNVSQVGNFAFVLIAIGIVFFIQPFIMPSTHIINGVNVGYEFEVFQFYSGLFCIILGILFYIIMKYYAIIRSLRPVSTKIRTG